MSIKEKKMGLGKSLKKLGKRIVSAVSDPKNLINPLFSVTELGEGVYSDYKKLKGRSKVLKIF